MAVMHAVLKVFAFVLATTDRSEVSHLIDTLRFVKAFVYALKISATIEAKL